MMKTFEVTVQKESPSTLFGLMLAQKTGSSQIVIKDISPQGAFAKTELLPGLQLLEICGQVIDTVKDAVEALKSAPIGKITVVAQGIVATALKKDMSTKAGLGIQKLKRPEGIAGPAELVVTSISETSIFANSGLKTGYRISSINGKACPPATNEATAMIREAVGYLTIVAVGSEVNPPNKASLGAYLAKHHVSMGADSTFESVKTVNGEADITIEPNSEAATERELNSMPIVEGGIVEEGVFDSEYGDPQEQEFTIEPDSEEACARMRNTEDGVVDSDFGEVDLPTTPNHLNEVTTTISKRKPGEKVGLALKNVKQSKSVIVNRLVKDGLATRSRSPLSLGQTILYINGQKCPPSAKRATTLVTEAPRTITIIARNTEVTAFKTTADTKLGITLRSTKRSSRVTVEDVDPDGFFGDSILAKGQTVVAINGEDCPDNALSAIELLRSTVGEVSVVVGYRGRQLNRPPIQEIDAFPPIVAAIEEPQIEEGMQEQELQIVEGVQEPEPEFVDAVQEQEPELVERASVQEPVVLGTRSVVSNKEVGKWIGVSFGKTEDMITVRKIQDESPLANSELEVGHAILFINNQVFPESITELISRIQRTSGELSLVSAPVEEAHGILAAAHEAVTSSPPATLPLVPKVLPGQVVAKVNKSKKEEKIGIRLVRSLQDRVVVSSITEGSLLSETDLAPGQFIVSINGTPCPPTKNETVKLLRDIDGPVEIIAFNSIGRGVKETADTKVGITLARTASNEMLIVGVKKGSILEDDSMWGLREDQRVVSINDEPCPDNVRDAIGLIKRCVGELTIVAVDRFKVPTVGNSEKESSCEAASSINSLENGTKSMPETLEAIPEFPDPVDIMHPPQNGGTPEFKEIVAEVYDKQASDMLGLSIGVVEDYAFVNHISVNSPFVNTDLCVGHRIGKIDGEDCPLPLSDAMELFAQHVGTMTIDAKEKILSPGQMSVSIVKQPQAINAGVGFGESDQGRVVVSKIDPKGLFADSELEIGHVVESVNGRRCFDAVAAYEMLMLASGKVTILISTTVASAIKQNIDQSTGILLGQSPDGKHIIVEGIEDGGIFAKTSLEIGQRVISIAGVNCPRSLAEADGLIQDRVGELTIVAVDSISDKFASSTLENGNEVTQESTPTITVSLYKSDQNSKVGMKMRKGIQEGKVIVSGVSEDGLVAGQGLEVGMHVISIDGIPCPSDPKTATGIIKEATGHFEIVASPTVASISKKTKDEKLGLTLARTETNDIVVHSIASNSAFKETDLQVGQKVVSVGGKKCSGLLDEAIRTLTNSVGSVTIVALDTLKS
ncbi:MAG: hypothetical protein SGBAC_005377 [Bacillariaceae sp.]